MGSNKNSTGRVKNVRSGRTLGKDAGDGKQPKKAPTKNVDTGGGKIKK